MNIETRQVVLHVLELTDADIERIVSDPNEFAAELMRLLPRSNGHTPATTGLAQRARRGKGSGKRQKKNGAKPGSARIGRPPKMMPCPACGEQVPVKSMGPHKRSCPKWQLKRAAGTLPAEE